MTNKCGRDGQSMEPMQKRDTAIKKPGDSDDDAKNHHRHDTWSPSCVPGGAEDLALILLFNCWCHYYSFAEGKTEAQGGKATCPRPPPSPLSFSSVPPRL